MSGKNNLPYEIFHKLIKQPLDHNNPSKGTLKQRVSILKPKLASVNSPVFFHLGEEQPLEDENLILLYDSYGKRNDLIYIHAEHRGYGKSISKDKDQTKPEYVKINQALADYHLIIEELKKEFKGPWIGAGYSYGGGLVINHAAKYFNDFEIILSSSGVIDWPFTMKEYDEQMRINFGDELYKSLVNVMNELKPDKLFDDNWYEREFLIACLHGIAQKEEFKRFQKTLYKLTQQSIDELLKQLHRIDNEFADRQAHNYAISNSKKTLNRKEALSGKYSWRVWRYQQCIETGVFEISEREEGVFQRNREDFIQESIHLFGKEPNMSKKKRWSPRGMIKEVEIPIIYICGGKDPWHGLGLENNFSLEQGRYFYFPNARHCPEKDKLSRGKKVIEEVLDQINKM